MPDLEKGVYQPRAEILQWLRSQNLFEGPRPTENLVAIPQLIAFDGPDGAGKDTIAKLTAEALSERSGRGNVIVLDITNLRSGKEQKHLLSLAKEHKLVGANLDQMYAAGVARAYKELVFGHLKEGKIVILNRSELDLLRFSLEFRDEAATKRREKLIENGVLNWGLWPGYRVFIDISPDDAWKNLLGRENNGPFDPRSLEGVTKRIDFQNKAESRILKMPHVGEIKLIRVTNRHLENPDERDIYLKQIAQSIADQIIPPREPSPLSSFGG